MRHADIFGLVLSAACACSSPAPAETPERPAEASAPVIDGQPYPDCKYDYRARNLAHYRAEDATLCIAELDDFYARVLLPVRDRIDAEGGGGAEQDAYTLAEARYRADRAYLEERYRRYVEDETYAQTAESAARDAEDGMVQQCSGEPGDSIFFEGMVGRALDWLQHIDTGTNVSGSMIQLACRLTAEERQAAAAASEAVVAREEVGATAEWVSPSRPEVSGSSTVTALTSEPSGATCLDVIDIVIIDGEEARMTKRLCRAAGETRYVLQS